MSRYIHEGEWCQVADRWHNRNDGVVVIRQKTCEVGSSKFDAAPHHSRSITLGPVSSLFPADCGDIQIHGFGIDGVNSAASVDDFARHTLLNGLEVVGFGVFTPLPREERSRWRLSSRMDK